MLTIFRLGLVCGKAAAGITKVNMGTTRTPRDGTRAEPLGTAVELFTKSAAQAGPDVPVDKPAIGHVLAAFAAGTSE